MSRALATGIPQPPAAGAPMPRLLRLLDRWFPPDPRTFLSGAQQTTHETVKAAETMGSYLAELGDERVRNSDVLDFGCGWGGETLWLAERVRSVAGVDVDKAAIAQAEAARDAAGVGNCRFVWSPDGGLAFPDASFDAVLSTDTFEHVMDLGQAYAEIKRVLRPGGSFLTRFGPLFYSPHGYHLYWACKVPYAHLLFGLDPIVALRAARGGAPRAAATWQDLGLNGRRFDEYRAAVVNAGLEIVHFDPIAVRGTRAAAAIPVLKDLFIFGIDCHVRRPL
jgi:SAM-dependent methyltransferase